MNHSQQKYALTRVDQIARDKLKALPQQTYDNDQEYKNLIPLLRSGELKLQSKVKTCTRHSSIASVFDLSPVDGDVRAAEAAYKKGKDAITAEAERIKDQIMLGDSAEALAMIEAFVAA